MSWCNASPGEKSITDEPLVHHNQQPIIGRSGFHHLQSRGRAVGLKYRALGFQWAAAKRKTTAFHGATWPHRMVRAASNQHIPRAWKRWGLRGSEERNRRPAEPTPRLMVSVFRLIIGTTPKLNQPTRWFIRIDGIGSFNVI